MLRNREGQLGGKHNAELNIANDEIFLRLILLTWFNFNPNMDK